MFKLIFCSLISILITSYSFSQSLLEVATSFEENIILEIPTKPKLPHFALYSKTFFKNKSLQDSVAIRELILKVDTTETVRTPWKKSDFPNKMLVRSKEKISVDQVLSNINWTTKKQKNTIKKAIKHYNNRTPKWRAYPMQISKPLYTEDGLYAVITFRYGNSAGKTAIYKKVRDQWTFYENFERWEME